MFNKIKIARCYSQALFKAAVAADASVIIAQQLDLLVSRIDLSPVYKRFLYSLSVPSSSKMKAMELWLNDYTIHPLLFNVICILVENRRLWSLPGLTQQYLKLMRKRDGEVNVRVKSATKLTSEECEKISSILSLKLQKTVILEKVVHKRMLGGLILIFDGNIIDCSFRTRLNAIRDSILKYEFDGLRFVHNAIHTSTQTTT